MRAGVIMRHITRRAWSWWLAMSVGCWLLSTLSSPAVPDWWITRQVLLTNAPANDYAPLLQGQMLWMVANAVGELDEKLPGGAGNVARSVIQIPGSNHFSAVNGGQLKQVSLALHKRLFEEGVVPDTSWLEVEGDDFAILNIGQAKNAFDFQISGARFYPSINGRIDYPGAQTGLFYVVATPVAGGGVPIMATVPQTGGYHMVVGGISNWVVESWRDSNGNALQESWEAAGEASGNPIMVTSVVHGVDLVLADPDEDGDGIAGWLEVQLGLDPYYADDALIDADGDGLSLGDELRFGSDPRDGDSDDDGMGDGAAVLNGYSPTNGVSLPGLPFAETFEAPVVPGDISGQNGWAADQPGKASVIPMPMLSGQNCLQLEASSNEVVRVSHPLATHLANRVWIDFCAVPVWRKADFPVPPATSFVSAFYVNCSGQVVVFDRTWPPGEWKVLTNAPVLQPQASTRFTVQLDFQGRRWGLWLNGTNIASALVFNGTARELARITFGGAAYSNSWLDQILVATNVPEGFVPDSNGDGMPDDWELANGLDPYSPSDSQDPDHDGVVNLHEFQGGWNPGDPDSDHDGWCDGVERAGGIAATNQDNSIIATIPFFESFEASATTMGNLHGQHGWLATAGDWAIVRTNAGVHGAQALQMIESPSNSVLSHLIKGSLGADAWSDWWAVPVRRRATGMPAVADTTTAAFYIDASGRPVVLDGTNWVVCALAPVVPEGSWTRFTVHHDYSNYVWSLFLDGVPAATNMGLFRRIPQYTGVRIAGAANAAAWLDDIRVTQSAPVDLDADGDGLPNGWEILHGLDPSNPSDRSDDDDADGLDNYHEYCAGTDPARVDSDGDGMGDGVEWAREYSPTNPADFAALPFVETFEPPAAVLGNLVGQHGWVVMPSNGAAILQTNCVLEGLQSLEYGGVNSSGVVYHPIAAASCPEIWTDFRVIPVFRSALVPPELNPASTVGFYVDGDGRIVVKDGGSWVTLDDHPALVPQTWHRFTAFQNFVSRVWELYLDGLLVATNLNLASPVMEYSGFMSTCPSNRTGYLDAIMVTTNPPSDIDGDHDGMPNGWEILHGLDPSNPSDGSGDADADGLDNCREYYAGADPACADSDGDGMGDGAEAGLGYAPGASNVFARLPLIEDFEPPAVAVGALQGQHGWDAVAREGAQVQDDVVWEGGQSLALSSTGLASHSGAATGVPLVWCDVMTLSVARYLDVVPVISSNTASAFYLNPDGCIVVCSGAAGTQRWDVVSNSTRVLTSRWVRLTVCQDYMARRWSLWVDGVSVACDLAFANPVTEFSQVRLSAPELSTGYVDRISITTQEPAGLDTDGDGLPNTWERDHGLDPAVPSDQADGDHDGLSNLEEYRRGTHPGNADTDQDGLVDGYDGRLSIGLLPNGVDGNGDGFADGELDKGCDPLLADTDGDGLTDGCEVAAGLDPVHSTLGQGLLAWYRLDETNGVMVSDSSSNHADGVWIGAGALAGTAGRMDRALDFSGESNGVWIAGCDALRSSSNYTLSAWARRNPDESHTTQVIVSWGSRYGLVLNGRCPEFRSGGADQSGVMAAPSDVPSADWVHLCVTLGGGEATLYVDGCAVATSNGVDHGWAGTSVMGIGYDVTLTNSWFNGSLDDVRLYDRRLSPGEIDELFILGSAADGNPQGLADEIQARAPDQLAPGAPVIVGDLDGDGKLTGLDHDRLLVLISRMTGHVARCAYDEEGNLTGRIDEMGHLASMSYDGNNRLLSSVDVNGHATSNARDASGAIVAVTDALGCATRFAYNAFGEATNVLDAAGNNTTIAYNAMGKVTRTTNASGFTQTTDYDALNRVRCVTVAAATEKQQQTWSFYDVADRLVSNRNHLGIVDEYRYDARGLVVGKTEAKGSSAEVVESTAYDGRGLAVSHTNALGNVVLVLHDPLGREVASTDELGYVTRKQYDNMGRLVAVIQPNGRTLCHEYDKWGREIRLRDGADMATIDYDVLDRVIAKTDWRGLRSVFARDAMGNITNHSEAYGTPDQADTRTDYDVLNRPVRTVDAGQHQVMTTYDALGNKIQVTDELGKITRWTYRYGARLEGYIKPDGTVVSNVYDALDRLAAVCVNGVVRQSFAYDGLSRLIQSVDYNGAGPADDAEVGYEYDAMNRVVVETQNGKQIRRQFDCGGHAIRLVYPSGFEVVRSYDAAGRLAMIGSAAAMPVYASYTYTPNSRICGISYGSGVVETHELDSRERLKNVTQKNANCNYSALLARDPDGNVTMCSGEGGVGALYQYDAQNRVVGQQSLGALLQESVTYDRMGNWLCHSNPAQGAVGRLINGANQYVRVGAAELAYNANGALTNWNGCEYCYDYLERLVEVYSNGVSLVRYGYDAANRRVRRDMAGTWTVWSYDDATCIEESKDGVVGNTFVYADTVDTPVALVRAGVPYFYLRDWRANVSAITDMTGRPVERYTYSLFGDMKITDGQGGPLARSELGNCWTYAGRQWDAETGLMHYRNRAYSPVLGRFLQPDPAGFADGMNLYAYAGNNPMMFSDPYGLYRWSHGNLDGRVGEWLFQQYGQLREIERQRRAYEEALRRAEEERQRIQREHEYAARAMNQFKSQHADEVRKMAGRYRHLGVNEDEAAMMLMSGITSIPRLGATVGPNDTRREWWLDYYLRGGRVNAAMRDEMSRMGTGNVDDYFAQTSQKETALRAKRKGKQQQYSLAAVAIVATVVTCGSGGAVGAALLGSVGVTASTVSFGAFVAGSVAIQGVVSAASTVISRGNIGDFAQSWAISSAASVAGYGAGFSTAGMGVDANVQLATQSAGSTLAGTGVRAAIDGSGFKDVFRDTAVSFMAGGVMGTFMNAPSGGGGITSFGEYVEQGTSSTFGLLHSPVSGGVQGMLHAAMYGGNVVEAFHDGAVSREALTQYMMASALTPVAGWMTSEIVKSLPNAPLPKAQPVEWREAPSPAPPVGGDHVVAVDSSPRQSGVMRAMQGAVTTLASHVREIAGSPARAISEIGATLTAESWRERSRAINPFSRSFIGYQILDKATDAAQVAAGLPISFLSGDFMDVQNSADMTFDANRKLVSFNGVANGSLDAASMRDMIRSQYTVSRSTHVVNRSALWGLGDAIQIIGNEIGAVDITAIRGSDALRKAGMMDGAINVVAHSQGSMTFRRALDLVDEPSVRGRIEYRGAGPEVYNSKQYLGLNSAKNLWNQESGSVLQRDPVPLANYLPLPARVLGDPFMMSGYAGWQRVDSPGNREPGNRHGFVSYYGGYAY